MTITRTAGHNVTMPSLGEAVTEATISRWLKSPGDTVEQGEPLLEVSTDKVDTEVPSPGAGIVLELVEPEDAVVEVGTLIAILGNDDTAPEPTPPVIPEPTTTPRTEQAPVNKAADSPSITAHTAAKPIAAPESSPDSEVVKLPRIRKTIARRMVESLQVAAQLTTVVEVDVTGVAAARAREKERFFAQTGTKLSFFPFFVVAALEAIDEHPVINSSLNADCTEVTYHRPVHLGIAVDSPKGLMVPVIRDARTMTIAEISNAVNTSAAAVRDGTIRADDLAGGTFTITNTGSRGALFDTPIINLPQSAILGVGSVVERLVPERDKDGNLSVHARFMAYLSLSYDHRIVDGADAARYLTAVRHRLETGFNNSELEL